MAGFFSTKPTKTVPMQSIFSALGVSFDLRASCDGLVRVTNKESRVAQLLESIEGFLKSDTMTEAEAATLRGRLQFAESQTYGRAVSLHMREVGQRAVGKKAGKHLTEGMAEELAWAKSFLKMDAPRLLRAHMSSRKLVIFTDAGLNRCSCLLGGRLQDRSEVLFLCNGSFRFDGQFSERHKEDHCRS